MNARGGVRKKGTLNKTEHDRDDDLLLLFRPRNNTRHGYQNRIDMPSE